MAARMRNLADIISQRVLPRISRPGQYIGLEINSRWPGRLSEGPPGVTVALAFPDAYTIGISHLGSQVLYQMLNETPGVGCDRAYCPLPDAEAVLRQEGVPLFGWESRCALRDFDIVGFSLGYELCVTTVLTMLDLAGIPLHARDRRDGDPIVIGGDALADSPEPLADFFDIFLIGDGEQPLAALVELVRRMKAQGASRADTILAAARTVPSAYAPGLYEPQYDAGGNFAGLTPLAQGLPTEIRRACLPNLSESPAAAAPLVPLAEAVHDRVTIEVMRGCPNACRFCQAGAVRNPVRARSVAEIQAIARAAIAATGYREISLLSLSTSDYPHLEELIEKLTAEFTPQKVSISLPSLRVDSQLALLPKLTSEVRKGGLTIAAEAGSDRLRQAIRKGITEADMIAGVRAAYAAGWQRVKVYFMAGLPGETEQDIDEIFELCKRLSLARKDVDGQKGTISASVSWAVPKPHTPMQWCSMRDAEYFLGVRRRLKDLAYRSPVAFKFHHVERSLLEALLCRGDRRVGAIIEAAWREGARLDAWDDYFQYDKWVAAMATAGAAALQAVSAAAGKPVTPYDYWVFRELPTDSPLPWSHIKCARGRTFLLAEYQRMRDAAK